MSSTTKVRLFLEPLDTLFFRDGRPFAPATRASSGLPTPQTLAGAAWTALMELAGIDFSRFMTAVRDKEPKSATEWAECFEAAGSPAAAWIAGVKVRGPWLARLQGNVPEILFNAPAVLHQPKDKSREDAHPLLRSSPLKNGQLPGWKNDDGLRPVWLRGGQATEPLGGYLTQGGMKAFLQGGTPLGKDLRLPTALLDTDSRTGIGVDADKLTAAEGQIYAINMLALKPRFAAEDQQAVHTAGAIGFYAEILMPSNAPANPFSEIRTLAFGGEGKRVRVETFKDGPAAERIPAAGNRKPLLVLTTPGIFDAGWKPGALDGSLIAAAVPSPIPVSGWDLARGGPKPTRFAAPAGSVYFLESLPTNLPPDCLADDDNDRAAGWGCYLQGVWTDA